MGLSDAKISENMEWLRKDAAMKWELDQIAQMGPNWREHADAMQQAATGQAPAGEQFSAAGGSSGLDQSSTSGPIPEFGGAPTPDETPAETPTETPTETPQQT